jgi:LytS/YehU family sensor histidine kinase
VYYFVPEYLYKKKYLQFFLALALGLLLSGCTVRLIQGYIILALYQPRLPFTPFDIGRFLWVLFDVSAPTFIILSFRLFRSRYESESRAQQLQNEKLLAELRFLKAQVSPHFLFNTLNNIYGLSLAQSPKTPESILKLSELLRFVLKNALANYIRLEQEIEILDNYIALEQLRYGDRLDLRFDKTIANPGLMVAPLLLLPLVENSFKHGASEMLHRPFVHITLRTQADLLYFNIANSKEQKAITHQEGTGLANLRRQLELLYRNSYSLDIENRDVSYSVTLTINLQKHEQAALYDC